MTSTEQSEFWRSEFGDDYSGRNAITETTLRERTMMWARVMQSIQASPPNSILEVGANVGTNLHALNQLVKADLHAVEPNATARTQLIESGLVAKGQVHDAIGTELPQKDASIDFVFTSGVLIHIAPEQLEPTCREMHRVSKRYIGCVEYFSAAPDAIQYRGHAGKLFKRDFGGFWWDLYPDLKLVDHGFFWQRVTGLDNLTWWLFEKP